MRPKEERFLRPLGTVSVTSLATFMDRSAKEPGRLRLPKPRGAGAGSSYNGFC